MPETNDTKTIIHIDPFYHGGIDDKNHLKVGRVGAASVMELAEGATLHLTNANTVSPGVTIISKGTKGTSRRKPAIKIGPDHYCGLRISSMRATTNGYLNAKNIGFSTKSKLQASSAIISSLTDSFLIVENNATLTGDAIETVVLAKKGNITGKSAESSNIKGKNVTLRRATDGTIIASNHAELDRIEGDTTVKSKGLHADIVCGNPNIKTQETAKIATMRGGMVEAKNAIIQSETAQQGFEAGIIEAGNDVVIDKVIQNGSSKKVTASNKIEIQEIQLTDTNIIKPLELNAPIVSIGKVSGISSTPIPLIEVEIADTNKLSVHETMFSRSSLSPLCVNGQKVDKQKANELGINIIKDKQR